MTHEQIEKAAEGLWDDWLLAQHKADEYSALEIPFDEADEMYRLWKERLTRFAQQCEADALERAELELCAAPIDVAECDGFDLAIDIIKNLKPKAL